MSERVEYQPEYFQPHSKKERNKNPKDDTFKIAQSWSWFKTRFKV